MEPLPTPRHLCVCVCVLGVNDTWTDRRQSVGIFSLETIRRMLGHQGRMVEALKIDVEGAEYAPILPAVEAGRFDHVRQLLIELHYERWPMQYPPRAPWRRRPKIVQPPSMHHRFFWAMVRAGWAIFHKEPNTAYALGSCVEYALLRLAWNASELIEAAKTRWCVGGWLNQADTFRPRCQGWGPLPAGEPTFRHLGYLQDTSRPHQALVRDDVTGLFKPREGEAAARG